MLIHNNILWYLRYVYDILIAHNNSITDIEKVLKMKFTMENEIDNTINFLDITIQKGIKNLFFDIYIYIYIYIEAPHDWYYYTDSCHPPEHKHAAIRHLVNRMNT